MKNFAKFILENSVNGYIKHISEDDAMKLILDNKYYFNPDFPIWRAVNQGMSVSFVNNYVDFNIVDPTAINRESPNAISNICNLLISNLPSWSNYPRRNKSLICGNYNRASEHFDCDKNDLYLVLPKYNSEIGMCQNDFWRFNFENFNSLATLNAYLTGVLNHRYFSDYKTLCDKLNSVDMEYLGEYANFIIPDNISTIEKLNILLDPNNHDFDLKKYNEDFSCIYNSDDIEYWTESESLLIRYDKVKELKLII